MSTCEYSEIFFSFNGEGKIPHGVGSLFVRTCGCNFTCSGFSNPTNQPIKWNFNPLDYKNLENLPLIEVGCDSAYTWHDDFRHLWKRGDVNHFADEIVHQLPSSFNGTFIHPQTGQDIILTFTGGEPTLRLKFLIQLLKHPLICKVPRVLFETNASVPIHNRINDLNELYQTYGTTFIFANSPKLSISGENQKIAINPSIVVDQQLIKGSTTYFKFVCDESDECFDEVDNAIKLYKSNGVQINSDDVLIMPLGASLEQQNNIDERVAMKTLERGYIFSPRSHVAVFGNRMGT